MQHPAQAEAPARLPYPIEAALAVVATLPELPPVLRAALAEIVRCVSATSPGRRFRLSVAHLMERMQRSDPTIDRYLLVLRSEGWIGREQIKKGARRDGWHPSWTWLTDKARDRLGLRGSILGYVPNLSFRDGKPCRVRRIPQDLADLAARIGAPRVVWLMARCRAAGRRLQEFAAQALAADSPAGFVLRALAGKRRETAAERLQTAGGDSRQDARAYLDAQQKAGSRTEAGRLAGLAMLRALRR